MSRHAHAPGGWKSDEQKHPEHPEEPQTGCWVDWCRIGRGNQPVGEKEREKDLGRGDRQEGGQERGAAADAHWG